MTKISYSIGDQTGEIYWQVAEAFDELRHKNFRLDEMEAVQIEKITDLSITAKILLSAVAGAIIQHLLDKNTEPELIFGQGVFWVS